jgi:hypothetical protein
MRRLLLVTGLLLAGCTATETGTPATGTTTTGTTTTESTATTATQDRPRAIDLNTVDVCAVVGALPRTTFGLDERPPTGGESTAFPGSRDCFANGIRANLGLTLVAVTDEGAAEYADSANAEVTATEVDGFTLHVLTPPVPDSCFGALDVADGQMLYVNYGLSAPGSQPVTPQSTLCERVPEIAAAALALL